MKKISIDRVLSGVAVIGWMIVIFLFSAQPAEVSSETSGGIVSQIVELVYPSFETIPEPEQMLILDTWQTVVRKGAHFCAYALLGALVANAIRTYNVRKHLRYGIPVAVSALYAISDEFHQYFVPGRSCQFLDMCIDTAGAVFGTAMFALAVFLIAKCRNKMSIPKHQNACWSKDGKI